jgi:putative DNA primase/helicase
LLELPSKTDCDEAAGDEMKMSEHCNGRWTTIISSLLGSDYVNTKKHGKCPKSGEGCDRYRFSDVNGRGNFFCGCSDGDKDGFELLQCVKGWSFHEACKRIEDVIGECPKDDDWKDQKPKVTAAERIQKDVIQYIPKSEYLNKRGLEVAPGLCWIKSLDFYNDGKKSGSYPAMLAPVVRDGKLLTYHATYLFRNGEKFRKILPADTSLQGACVQLYPAQDVLGVAEGIETAIAAKMLTDIPTWSVLNTSLMKSWKPPSRIKKVVIFGDNDENFAGHSAAYTLAHRLKKTCSVELEVRFPPETGTDFNDLLLSNGSE